MADGCEFQEGEAAAVQILPALGEATASIQPCDGALDDPALGQLHEAFGVIGAFDDLGLEIGQDFSEPVRKNRTLIGAIGKQLLKERKLAEQRGEQQQAAIAVLNVGGMDDGVQQQTECIDQNMPLLALDQLTGIEAMRIDAGPPFSALFTL